MYLAWKMFGEQDMVGKLIKTGQPNYTIKRVDGVEVAIHRDLLHIASDIEIDNACMYFDLEAAV